MKIAAFLSHLHRLGVKLRVEAGELRISGPRDVLTPELQAEIDSRAAELTDLVGEISSAMAESDTSLIEPIPRDRGLQLSFAQQRFWLLAQLEGYVSAYDTRLILWLRGGLDVAALEWALGEIVCWQEILRTTLEIDDGLPVQVVARPGPFELPVVDLPLDSDALGAAVQFAHDQAKLPFDLASGPLFRFVLLRSGPVEHALVLTMHHATTDGHTMHLLLGALDHLYRARCNGMPPQLPELPVQYADYAAWQRRRYERDRPRLLAYWQRQLRNLATLTLPTDRPRPPRQTFRGARHHFVVPETVARRLVELGRQERSTLFVVMVAAFKVLLARYSGQRDVAVGTPVANRDRAETEHLIGPLLNTLVLRTDLSGNPTFRQLLARVRQVSLDALRYQEMPFEQLVAELRPPRDLSRNPLFQVLFNLLIEAPTVLGDLDVERIRPDVATSALDLSLTVCDQAPNRRSNEPPTGYFDYSTDLFDDATIERMERHFQLILAGVVTDPDQCIWDLPILTEQERQLYAARNRTARSYSAKRGIGDLIDASVDQSPDAVAATCGDESLTFRELNASANQLAHHLRELGAGPNRLVGISVERSLKMLVALLAIAKSGAAYVPLDPSLPVDRLEFLLREAGIELVVTEESLRSRLPAAPPRLIRLDEDAELIAAHRRDNPAPVSGPGDLAYVIYTSGSTGAPKGVAIEQRALVNLLTAMVHRPGFSRRDVLVAVTTISFDIAALELFVPLLVGARVVIATSDAASDGQQLAELLRSSAATVMQATPTTWRLLLDSGWGGDPKLVVLSGGEALPRELADRLMATCSEVWNLYGPTETTVWSLAERVEPGDGPVPIGEPIANTQVHLLDRRGEPVPIGVPGTLFLGGDGLAWGYWRRPELTARGFAPDPFSHSQGARLYDTGDIARYRADGKLEFLGRADHQIKIRGFRIELGEIEHVLRIHPAVQDCAVVAQPRAPGDYRLVASIVSHPGAQATVTELREFLRGRLPAYMVATAFQILDQLPLLPTGKVNRQALAQSGDAQAAHDDQHVPPRTSTEVFLAKVWQECLGVDRVGLRDNFFDLGGHSLLAIQVIHRIEQEYGRRISTLEFLIEDLGQLATACDRADTPSAS